MQTTTEALPQHHHHELSHHETDEDAATAVAIVTVVICAFVAVIVITIVSFAQWWTERQLAKKSNYPVPEVVAQRRYERELLEGYTWVDKQKGIVRVPVTKAMELVLEEQASSDTGR